jgi:2-polyprenyl-3-methyl-5-hydroxy-6-metoxy-1,4-benzoquinol methylase
VSTVREHYDQLLGPIYAWMLGDTKAALAAARRELGLLELSVLPDGATRRALDLGTGLGTHAMALAELGYDVVGIDSCAQLVAEARSAVKRAGLGDSVRFHDGEITAFRSEHPGPYDVILCMGDTLTHLSSLESVRQLFADCAASLAPGGVFATTFRDYSGEPRQGADRFIPVRSDAQRIFTCFLETHSERVTVHDVLHTLLDGGWQMRVSTYDKLRLDPQWLLRMAQDSGLESALGESPRGMVQLTARRA